MAGVLVTLHYLIQATACSRDFEPSHFYLIHYFSYLIKNTVMLIWFITNFYLTSITQSGKRTRNAKKPLNRFKGCHENLLNESCKMCPLLIGLGWHPRSLLWPTSGSCLDMIWKLKCQLRHIKWGLLLKLSLRPFLSHPWNPLRGFFAFRVPGIKAYDVGRLHCLKKT